MRKKNVLVGVIQIVLSIGILGGGVVMYLGAAAKTDFSQTRLVAQIKQAEAMRNISTDLQKTLPQHEKALLNLHNALGPLRRSVDAIVNLRDYTIMNKKPLYALGNSFVGFQTAIHEVQSSLDSARQSFAAIAKLQEQEFIPATESCIAVYKAELAPQEMSCRYEKLAHVGIYFLAGLGFLINGLYLCCRKETV